MSKEIQELKEIMLQGFGIVEQRFDKVEKRFEAVDKRFESVEKRFDSIEKRFDKVDADLTEVKERLAKIELAQPDDIKGILTHIEKSTESLTKDVDYLSEKVGKHDLFFDRLNRQ